MVESFSVVMAKRRIFHVLLASALVLTLPGVSSGQLVIGQYEDEAPLRTWNIFGFQTAAAVGRGDTSFAAPASDPSAALTNPALLADLSGFRLTLNGMAQSTALHKFSIVNTGVLATDGNLFLNLYGLDFAGISYSRKGWAVAFNVYLSEIYDRPRTEYQYFYRDRLYYAIDFSQDGFLRTFNLSLARKLGSRFRAGIGLNVVTGELSRQIDEQWTASGISIRDSKKQEFSGFFLNGGVLVGVTEKIDLALVFRTPYRKSSPGESALVYDAPAGGTDIRIAASATSRYEQPFVLGLGASYAISPSIQITADAAFFNWASYRVEYFEEEIERDFRNAIKAALGAEFRMPLRLFKKEASIPVRLGVGYDEQPMKNPRSAYMLFSAGIGLHWSVICLDLGASLGRESGSGDSLEARRMALSLTLKL